MRITKEAKCRSGSDGPCRASEAPRQRERWRQGRSSYWREKAAQKKFAARSIIREEDYTADRAWLNGFVSDSEIPVILKKTEELIEEHWRDVTELAQELLRKGTIKFVE
jgi:hypothetical protein